MAHGTHRKIGRPLGDELVVEDEPLAIPRPPGAELVRPSGNGYPPGSELLSDFPTQLSCSYCRLLTGSPQMRIHLDPLLRFSGNLATPSNPTPLATNGRGTAARALPVFPTATAEGRSLSIFAASFTTSAPWLFASNPPPFSY